MSVAIGLLGKDFSLVAGDDRATNRTPRNETGWTDGEEKVFLVPFGFVAASGGIAGVKDRFKAYLNKYVVKSRKDIWRQFCCASRDCEKFLLSGDIHNKDICTSRFTYSLNYFQAGTLHMEIDTLDFMFHTRRLNAKSTLLVNSPKDTKRIKRLETKYFDLARNVTDMHEAVYLVACLIDEMAKLTKLISNNVQCGITFKVSENELVFLKVSENAKAIKKLYKQRQDLSEIMMVEREVNNGQN